MWDECLILQHMCHEIKTYQSIVHSTENFNQLQPFLTFVACLCKGTPFSPTPSWTNSLILVFPGIDYSNISLKVNSFRIWPVQFQIQSWTVLLDWGWRSQYVKSTSRKCTIRPPLLPFSQYFSNKNLPENLQRPVLCKKGNVRPKAKLLYPFVDYYIQEWLNTDLQCHFSSFLGLLFTW